MLGMTTYDITTEAGRFQLVAFDLYRDIHKGIRTELFAVTTSAGQTDPSDRVARAALAAHVRDLQWLLETHAEHEDAAIQPLMEQHLPEVAEQVARDHVAFDARVESLVALATDAVDAPTDARRGMVHCLYADLASFTGVYLAHQDLEERVVMPGLEAAVGIEAILGVHQQIIGSIPPQDMARSLALMLPAMNVDDRTEMLGGMRAGAPPEVFEGVWGLTGSVLGAADRAALAARLGVN
jgi:hypothetical protein